MQHRIAVNNGIAADTINAPCVVLNLTIAPGVDLESFFSGLQGMLRGCNAIVNVEGVPAAQLIAEQAAAISFSNNFE